MSTSVEDLGFKEDAAREKMHVEISEARKREREPHYVMEWEEDGGGKEGSKA